MHVSEKGGGGENYEIDRLRSKKTKREKGYERQWDTYLS